MRLGAGDGRPQRTEGEAGILGLTPAAVSDPLGRAERDWQAPLVIRGPRGARRIRAGAPWPMPARDRRGTEAVRRRAGSRSPGRHNQGVRSLLIVDGANVVGSVPDGWWRDRFGAAERLRDRLDAGALDADVVLVVEGRAKGVRSTERVVVHDAPGSGDDAIVALVRATEDRTVTVVTADRGLRERVLALGAQVAGPRSLPFW